MNMALDVLLGRPHFFSGKLHIEGPKRVLYRDMVGSVRDPVLSLN